MSGLFIADDFFFLSSVRDPCRIIRDTSNSEAERQPLTGRKSETEKEKERDG